MFRAPASARWNVMSTWGPGLQRWRQSPHKGARQMRVIGGHEELWERVGREPLIPFK